MLAMRNIMKCKTRQDSDHRDCSKCILNNWLLIRDIDKRLLKRENNVASWSLV